MCYSKMYHDIWACSKRMYFNPNVPPHQQLPMRQSIHPATSVPMLGASNNPMPMQPPPMHQPHQMMPGQMYVTDSSYNSHQQPIHFGQQQTHYFQQNMQHMPNQMHMYHQPTSGSAEASTHQQNLLGQQNIGQQQQGYIMYHQGLGSNTIVQQQPLSVSSGGIGSSGGIASQPFHTHQSQQIGTVSVPVTLPSTHPSLPTAIVKPLKNNESDLTLSTRMLILKDLRRAIMDVNAAADRLVDQYLSQNIASSSLLSVSLSDDKKPAPSVGPSSNVGAPYSNLLGGPNSNLNISGGPHSIGPHSNLNPSSVQNPQSIQNLYSTQNPQSVQPHSGTTEESTAAGPFGSKDMSGTLCTTPAEMYTTSRDNFLNVCDDIEKNLTQLMGLYQMYNKLELLSIPNVSAEPTTLKSHLLPYITTMNDDKKNLELTIKNVNNLINKLS